MLKNAYLLAKIGADAAENEWNFAEHVPKICNYPTCPLRLREVSEPPLCCPQQFSWLPTNCVTFRARAIERQLTYLLNNPLSNGRKTFLNNCMHCQLAMACNDKMMMTSIHDPRTNAGEPQSTDRLPLNSHILLERWSFRKGWQDLRKTCICDSFLKWN